jgi:anti-sigma regulatory factor (Ser/Thr protein kinase)
VNAKQRLRAYLSRRQSATGRELREHLGISRQALNVHLRALIESEEVIKAGSTRGARYFLSSRGPAPVGGSYDLALPDLDESAVYDKLATALNLRTLLRHNVEAIFHYAFTEMLNNAIEHSEADRSKLRLRLDAGTVSFALRDRGIGVFYSVASKLQLADEHAALVELLKGRTTTMAERHTGEGIFFTSKVADRFVLRSHRTEVEWNRYREDVFVAQRRYIEGTNVDFFLRRDTKRLLDDVFGSFAPAEYDFRFQKTRVFVKLLKKDYISRSEAKRLLSNLEKFSEIVLDFRGVQSIGQGFADEVFRVFANRHPAIKIRAENAVAPVDAMLRHSGMP